MAVAGYGFNVSVATAATSVTYAELDGAISFSLSDADDMLDITDFKDPGRFRRKIVGLRDISASIDGDLEAADAGYLRIKACKEAGTVLYLKATLDGTNGIVVPTLIETLDRSASVEGKVEVSISLSQTIDSNDVVPFAVGSGF